MCRKIIDHDGYELVELMEETDVLLDVGEPSDRRRAELVAVFSCLLVCSCMMLTQSVRQILTSECQRIHTEHTMTWLVPGCRGRSFERSCVEEPWARNSSQ